MVYELWLDTEENRALLAICARKLIRNTGIGAIVWGGINLLIGAFAVTVHPINIGILVLAVMMLASGVRAIQKPSLDALRTEAIVSIVLLAWNVSMTVYNLQQAGVFDPRGLIFPIVVAVTFFGYHKKLQHVREQVETVEPERIKTLQQLCKTLQKKKLKEEPEIVQASSRCRAQLIGDRAFFVQADMMKAFVASRREVQACLVKPDAKKLAIKVRHPMGVLTYKFDKKNSDRLRNWLATAAPDVALPVAQPV